MAVTLPPLHRRAPPTEARSGGGRMKAPDGLSEPGNSMQMSVNSAGGRFNPGGSPVIINPNGDRVEATKRGVVDPVLPLLPGKGHDARSNLSAANAAASGGSHWFDASASNNPMSMSTTSQNLGATLGASQNRGGFFRSPGAASLNPVQEASFQPGASFRPGQGYFGPGPGAGAASAAKLPAIKQKEETEYQTDDNQYKYQYPSAFMKSKKGKGTRCFVCSLPIPPTGLKCERGHWQFQIDEPGLYEVRMPNGYYLPVTLYGRLIQGGDWSTVTYDGIINGTEYRGLLPTDIQWEGAQHRARQLLLTGGGEEDSDDDDEDWEERHAAELERLRRAQHVHPFARLCGNPYRKGRDPNQDASTSANWTPLFKPGGIGGIHKKKRGLNGTMTMNPKDSGEPTIVYAANLDHFSHDPRDHVTARLFDPHKNRREERRQERQERREQRKEVRRQRKAAARALELQRQGKKSQTLAKFAVRGWMLVAAGLFMRIAKQRAKWRRRCIAPTPAAAAVVVLALSWAEVRRIQIEHVQRATVAASLIVTSSTVAWFLASEEEKEKLRQRARGFFRTKSLTGRERTIPQKGYFTKKQ